MNPILQIFRWKRWELLQQCSIILEIGIEFWRIIQSTVSKDVRQDWNSKPAGVGFSSKKAGTTYASTSKNLSLNYLNPYLVIAFVEVLEILILFSFHWQI